MIDDDYRRIMQMRTQLAAANNSSRVTKIISDKQAKSKSMVATAGHQWDVQSRFTKKKVVVDKRERMPKNDLLDLIFHVFQDKEIYNFKELQDKTQQPSQWLKEILNEVCILGKGGLNNGMYQLKPEYIQKKEEIKE
jgi:transcription initiation factor TFIIF subunit beta